MAEIRTPEQMDASADLADAELGGPKFYSLLARQVADWWKRWYMEAGHKRLGRVLLKYATK